MHRTQILLDPEQHQELVEMANQEKRSLSDLIREMLQKQLKAHKQERLREAAAALRKYYLDDEDLTALTVLDSEDFHE